MAKRKPIKADKSATKSGRPKKKRVCKPRGPGHGMTPFVPTDEQKTQVEILVGLGLTYDEIASVIINPRTKIGISKMTLQKYFPDEIAQGGARSRYVDVVIERWQNLTGKKATLEATGATLEATARKRKKKK